MQRAARDWLVEGPAPPLGPFSDGGEGRVSLDDYRGRPVLVSFLSHAA